MPAREGAWAVYELFETKDGQPIFIGITSDNHWERFCKEFGREDLLADPNYASNEARVAMRPTLLPLVASLVKPHTMAEMVAIAERIGVPFAPVAETKHLHDDAHLNAGRGMLPVNTPNGEPVKLPRLSMEMGDHDLGLFRQPPGVGEHTAEVMLEAGYSQAEIEDLAAQGAVVLGA